MASSAKSLSVHLFRKIHNHSFHSLLVTWLLRALQWWFHYSHNSRGKYYLWSEFFGSYADCYLIAGSS